MRVLLALLGAELRRLSRTEQVHRYMLLPALLLIPGAIMVGTLVASARGQPTVAVPPELPASFDLVAELEERELSVEAHADPVAAFLAEEVDAAVVVEVREGIGAVGEWEAGAWEVADPARYVVHVATVDRGAWSRIRRAVEAAGDEALAHEVALAGGQRGPDLLVAEVQAVRLPGDEGLDLDAGRVVLAYGAFLAGSMGFVFLSLSAVADREEGVTEVLRTLPISPTAVLWARVLALALLQLLAAGLVLFNVLLLLVHAAVEVRDALPGPWAVLSFTAVMVLSNAAYGAVGVWAPSAKAANNGASLAMFALIALLVAGVLTDAPSWVPVAGAVTATDLVGHLLAALSTTALAALILAGTGRALRRRVDLVLPMGGSE